jgi:glycosyltransferase involved in cell wall biosynthesis
LLVLDHDPELIRYFKSELPSDVRVLSSGGLAFECFRNAGIINSKSEIIAFIDDDAVADRDWLKNLFKNYSEPSVAGVGGLVVPRWDGGRSFSWFPEELNWIIGCSYKGQIDRREPIRNPIGCNMSFRMKFLRRWGISVMTLGDWVARFCSMEKSLNFQLGFIGQFPMRR